MTKEIKKTGDVTEIIDTADPVHLSQEQAEPGLTKEQVEAWQKAKMLRFWQAVGKLSEEHEMILVAVPAIAADGRIVARIEVQPK